jgi:hypothetical protein
MQLSSRRLSALSITRWPATGASVSMQGFWARKEIAALLGETLAEEKAADKKLGMISKQINSGALKAA